MDKIYSIDFNVNLIDFLSEQLLKENARDNFDFSQTIVVFPGKRQQFYLRRDLSERIKKAFYPPSIMSIEEFIQFLAAKVIGTNQSSFMPISLVDACFFIHNIVQRLELSYLDWQKQLAFEHFYLWAMKIFQFLEEMDKELVSEAQLLNVEDNAQIGLPLPDYVNRLLENINQIRKEFHKALEDNKLTTSGFNYYRVANESKKIPLEEFQRIYFAGFFALNAAEKKIIKQLLNQGKAYLIWQRSNERYSIFQELDDFFDVCPKSENSTNKKSSNIQICAAFDAHSQAEAAREALATIKDFENTCVVLSGSGSLMPLLYQAIPSDLANYNISLGYPLRRSCIYTLIQIIMQTQEKRRADGSFYINDYLKLLVHPYLKNISGDEIKPAAARILIHKIEEGLLGLDKSIAAQKSVFVKFEEVEDNPLTLQAAASVIQNSNQANIEPKTLRKHLSLIHEKFFRVFDLCQTLKDYASAVESMLYFILQQNSVNSDIFAVEAFGRLLKALESLKYSLFKEHKFRDKTEFFELLKSSIFFEKIPFNTTPLGGLQILGLLETRNLNFKNLIVLDLNEGVLPKIESGDSLIPDGIFPMLGLPHYHRKEEIIRYHFRRLMAAAQNIFLIYQVSSKDRESRSRFIEEIIWQEEKEKRALYDWQKLKYVEFKVASKKEQYCLKKTPMTRRLLKETVYSATSLDTYLKCPAQFYFRY